MIDEGQILSRHEFRKKNSRLTILAIIFIFSLSLVVIISSNMTPGFSILFILSILCATIAVVSLSSLLYLFLHNGPIFTYFLYEKGVRVFNHHNGNVYFITFNKIQYIHKYHSGINPNGDINTMAFRTSKVQQWNIIINNITNAYPLINTIIHQQVMHVGIMSLNTLSRGKTIVFDVIKKNDNWLKMLIFNGLLNISMVKNIEMDTIPLSLSAHKLITTDGIINIEDILRIEILRENHHDKIRLFDTKGDILFSVDYSTLISADLFIALVEHMIQNRIPAYYG
ncbi:hypothetical protein [Yersinia pekkanenii]|uniref:Uncharacterized protein n=1 Tax=Yersinia pekkanenii TaxID=1288385 RepID=A0A0T9NCZ1_9GAMM|nr:hypothetical protein [Yersinia pekkanenii]CNH00094.1 Uncharacterised protein [Yersinia pekkanenii]CRY64126.1 Uncharacterised protein [Yersinia pekkanenii]